MHQFSKLGLTSHGQQFPIMSSLNVFSKHCRNGPICEDLPLFSSNIVVSVADSVKQSRKSEQGQAMVGHPTSPSINYLRRLTNCLSLLTEVVMELIYYF